jgi:hypothetical protein
MIKSLKLWSCFILACLALFGLARMAGAAIITIPPNAFRPIDSVSDNDHTWYANEQMLYVKYSVDGPYFSAPVYLPDGVTVKKVTVILTDNGAGPDDEVRVSLHRQKLLTGAQVTMAYLNNHAPALTHSSSRQAMTDTTISNATVNNNLYSYTVNVWFIFSCTDRVKIHGVKIEY